MYANDIGVAEFDFPAVLAHLTSTNTGDWVEKKGPRSKSGLDYWFDGPKGAEAYANINQFSLVISFDGLELNDAPDWRYEFDFDELPPDHWLRGHVRTDGPTPVAP